MEGKHHSLGKWNGALAEIGPMINFVDGVRSWSLFFSQDCGVMFMDVAGAIANMTHSSARKTCSKLSHEIMFVFVRSLSPLRELHIYIYWSSHAR